MTAKDDVRDFWNNAACGEELLLSTRDRDGFAAQAEERYRLEPYIPAFADFAQAKGLDVLEIGVGLGADHESYGRAGANLHGIDLTDRAIALTKQRLAFASLQSDLRVGDAEALPFADDSFDLVYSWGVIHHSPDTAAAAREILRVLKPGGRFRVMIYHKWSLVGAMLWLRYALAKGRPGMSLAEIYSTYLESPGTKAYTRREAVELFGGASEATAWVELTHGDLLESGAGQRHQGLLLTIARRIWPRWLLRRLGKGLGLFLLVSGTK
ncbi:class I SAM-dependent methyltransferase [Bosea sp. (in: a-proteobacteria)]|uniref:class I SAM-dependent methyltransferase n=1 Tax=Bosea sp. (in: a-proteobacteria) TaxID=1871050 RepID=UPI0026245A9F|nr:class I SAM-dependent methyltransferase [Bosea sp. (in: a-proteobacteria)]MCO5091027.1 class I SAM-dependent methyltransferase [Bosea sp. (in: a-proteobacteria)]